MSIVARFRGSQERLIRHFGEAGTVTLRQRHSLRDPSTGSVPTTLAVAGLTAVGSGVIDLDATYLEGSLIPGITFTIAGDATSYTAENTVEAGSNVLSGVAFVPPLATQAADDAVVTLVSTTADTTVKAAVSRFVDEVIDGTRIMAGDRLVILDVKDLSVEVDTETQVVANGTVYQIQDVLPLSPGASNFAMRLHVGRR